MKSAAHCLGSAKCGIIWVELHGIPPKSNPTIMAVLKSGK